MLPGLQLWSLARVEQQQQQQQQQLSREVVIRTYIRSLVEGDPNDLYRRPQASELKG